MKPPVMPMTPAWNVTTSRIAIARNPSTSVRIVLVRCAVLVVVTVWGEGFAGRAVRSKESIFPIPLRCFPRAVAEAHLRPEVQYLFGPLVGEIKRLAKKVEPASVQRRLQS